MFIIINDEDESNNVTTKTTTKQLMIAGTPSYPDLKTYCEKVNLEKFDTFLILSASRFTENDLQLAKKVESIKKSFFSVRTKIDHDIDDQQFDYPDKTVDSILTEIKKDCQKNLSSSAATNKNTFLISNHHTDNWDFPGLRKAIQDTLPRHQRESLILSLTSASMDVIKQKVEVLRGNYYTAQKITLIIRILRVFHAFCQLSVKTTVQQKRFNL